jgi:hypothetical protein
VKWIRWIALLAGIGMFAASFMLPAVKQASSAPGSQGIPGYECAFIALVVVLEQGGQLVRENPVQFFAVLFSGWITPLFLVSLLLVLIKPRWRFTIWLRYVVTAMFVAGSSSIRSILIRGGATFFGCSESFWLCIRTCFPHPWSTAGEGIKSQQTDKNVSILGTWRRFGYGCSG